MPASVSVVAAFGQQPVPEFAYGEVADGGEGLGVVPVDNQAGDFVFFIGHNAFVQEASQRDLGQEHLRLDPFLFGACRNTRENVARTEGRSRGQKFAERPAP